MIRKFKQSDVEQILDVWYQSSLIAHSFLDADFLDKERKNIRDIYIPNTETWVFVNEASLEGFISMMGNEVGAIFVRPEQQGRGIGKRLMDIVSELHDELEVDVFKENKIGRTFYDRYGFVQMREYIHEETGNAILRLKYICKSDVRVR